MTGLGSADSQNGFPVAFRDPQKISLISLYFLADTLHHDTIVFFQHSRSMKVKITYQQVWEAWCVPSTVTSSLYSAKSMMSNRKGKLSSSAVSHIELPKNTKHVLFITQCLTHSKPKRCLKGCLKEEMPIQSTCLQRWYGK